MMWQQVKTCNRAQNLRCAPRCSILAPVVLVFSKFCYTHASPPSACCSKSKISTWHASTCLHHSKQVLLSLYCLSLNGIFESHCTIPCCSKEAEKAAGHHTINNTSSSGAGSNSVGRSRKRDQPADAFSQVFKVYAFHQPRIAHTIHPCLDFWRLCRFRRHNQLGGGMTFVTVACIESPAQNDGLL